MADEEKTMNEEEQKPQEPIKAENLDFTQMNNADKRALEDKLKKIDASNPYSFKGGLKSAADSKTVEGSANALLLTILTAPIAWVIGLVQKWNERQMAKKRTQLKNAQKFNEQVLKDKKLTKDQARDYLFQDFIKTHDDKAKINAEWTKTHPEIYTDFVPDENGVYSPKDQREIDARILQIRHGELYGRTMFIPEVEGALNEVERIHVLPPRENFVVPNIHGEKAVAQTAEPEKQTQKRPTYTATDSKMSLRDAQKNLAKTGNTETFKAQAHDVHLKVEGLRAQTKQKDLDTTRTITVKSAQLLNTKRGHSNG